MPDAMPTNLLSILVVYGDVAGGIDGGTRRARAG